MSRLCSAPVMVLAFLGLGCGSEGSEPSEEPAIHNRLVFELLGQLGVMAPDGSHRQILPTGDDLEMASDPAVSPDGKRVAFSAMTHDQWDLYVMNADGSDRRQVTSDSAHDFSPAWSPDGDSLVFTHSPVERLAPVVLTVIAVNGTGRRDLAQGSGGQWSPDGQRVMFYGTEPWGAGIYVTDRAGQAVSRLDTFCHETNCVDSGVRWSPDGAFISFARSLPGSQEAVGIMRADGSDPRLLLPTLHTMGGIWSPDGQQVALNRWDDAEQAYSTYILTVATGDTVRIPSTLEFIYDWPE
jgi:TolB protein